MLLGLEVLLSLPQEVSNELVAPSPISRPKPNPPITIQPVPLSLQSSLTMAPPPLPGEDSPLQLSPISKRNATSPRRHPPASRSPASSSKISQPAGGRIQRYQASQKGFVAHAASFATRDSRLGSRRCSERVAIREGFRIRDRKEEEGLGEEMVADLLVVGL